MKKKKNNVFIYLVLIFFTIMFIYSGYNIIEWKKDSTKTIEKTESIIENTELKEISAENSTIVDEEKAKQSGIYFDYMKINMLDVDLNKLKNENNDTIGWIQVEGTNVNYPFVQTNDNEYYLNHSFDKTINNAGWIFLDYRNNKDFTDKNTIIYGHGRVDSTMFGTLKNILDTSWQEKSENHYIKFSLENKSLVYQIFSSYTILTTNDYIKVNFNDDYQDFLNMIINRSFYNYNVSVTNEDKIITLSTCYNNDKKMVVHAKLIMSLDK